MPSSPKIEQALENLRRAAAVGRLPHGLVIAGHPRAAGTELVNGLLQALYGMDEQPERFRQHPDIHWVEPESKSRQIRVDLIRALLESMGLTSYSGGWKTAVILFADRMNPNAQNSLLKMLEEPPPHSLILLVTDTPSALLPTIRSRTQYVDILDDGQTSEAPWLDAVMELLRTPPPRRACEMVAWADQLTVPLRELEDIATAEETEREENFARLRGSEAELAKSATNLVVGRVASRVIEMREEILRTIQLWQRDVLAQVVDSGIAPVYFPDDAEAIAAQASGLSFAGATARVDAVDEVRRLLACNIRESVALIQIARAIAQPVAQ